MRVYFSDRHVTHSPKTFLVRGQMTQCPEVPERADILLSAATQDGHEICAIENFGLDPVMRIHDQGHVEFLESAWEEWSKLPNPAPEVVPNVHPGRNMNGTPQTILGKAGRYQADAACPIGVGTWEAVRTSADTALTAASTVMTDFDSGEKTPFAYALSRPPGHHAFADQAGGFCYLNNSAMAAQQNARGKERLTERTAVLQAASELQASSTSAWNQRHNAAFSERQKRAARVHTRTDAKRNDAYLEFCDGIGCLILQCKSALALFNHGYLGEKTFIPAVCI